MEGNRLYKAGYRLRVTGYGLLLFVLLPIIAGNLHPVFASTNNSLTLINQKVCKRFEDDVSKLAAIMDEIKDRKGIKETRVAFGGIDTQIKSADYWVTYAAEAVAYQKAQKYSSQNELKYSLEALKGKILKAKAEVRKALNSE